MSCHDCLLYACYDRRAWCMPGSVHRTIYPVRGFSAMTAAGPVTTADTQATAMPSAARRGFPAWLELRQAFHCAAAAPHRRNTAPHTAAALDQCREA
jgi:hypothetical protein